MFSHIWAPLPTHSLQLRCLSALDFCCIRVTPSPSGTKTCGNNCVTSRRIDTAVTGIKGEGGERGRYGEDERSSGRERAGRREVEWEWGERSSEGGRMEGENWWIDRGRAGVGAMDWQKMMESRSRRVGRRDGVFIEGWWMTSEDERWQRQITRWHAHNQTYACTWKMINDTVKYLGRTARPGRMLRLSPSARAT